MDAAERIERHRKANREWAQRRRFAMARHRCPGPRCLSLIPNDRELCAFCRKSLRLGLI